MTPSSPPTVPPLAKTLAWNGVAFLVVGAITRFGLERPETGPMFVAVGMVAGGLVWTAVGAARARRRRVGDPG